MARFLPGQSGNPRGRAPNAPRSDQHAAVKRHAARLAQEIFDDNAEVIVRTVLERAKQGDPTAMKLCVERVLPPRKSVPISFKMPPAATDDECMPEAILKALIRAVGSETVMPEDALNVVAILRAYMEARDHSLVTREFARLEQELQQLKAARGAWEGL